MAGAYTQLNGVDPGPRVLARLLGRGGTSGIGVGAFESGFIERLVVVFIHGGMSALAVSGFMEGRYLRWYLVAVGIHSGINIGRDSISSDVPRPS